MPWLEPSLSLRWGPYTKLDGDEQGIIVKATLVAKEGGIITTRMAVEKIAPFFGIENVDAAIEAIEEEKKKNAEEALQQTVAEQKSLHGIMNAADESGAGRAGAKEPKGAQGS